MCPFMYYVLFVVLFISTAYLTCGRNALLHLFTHCMHTLHAIMPSSSSSDPLGAPGA